MLIDTDKIKAVLDDTTLTDYQIEKAIGISRVTVRRYREKGMGSMKLDNAVKFMELYKQRQALYQRYSK